MQRRRIALREKKRPYASSGRRVALRAGWSVVVSVVSCAVLVFSYEAEILMRTIQMRRVAVLELVFML